MRVSSHMTADRDKLLEDVASVWASYKEGLDAIEGRIKKEVDSEVPLINQVAHYTLNSGGKRIRPLLLTISARLCGCTDPNALQLGGAILEFIHTATLLHDDVIDDATVRRGAPAARSLWGNQACILVGDYLYTLAICQAARLENLAVNHLFAQTCRKMSEGETLQLMHNNDFDLSEASYLKIVSCKTASLLSAACHLGGLLAGAPDAIQESLARFGQNVGIAFQVADDTLDYVADLKRLGKAPGQDFREGKMTLPLLHFLKSCTPAERQDIKELMDDPALSPEQFSDVILRMEQRGSIAYARKRAQEFSDRAKADLSLFDDSPDRQSLMTVADYVVQRDH